MRNLYEYNGLVFYDETDINAREYLIHTVSSEIIASLSKGNKAFVSKRIEAPCLIPCHFISDEYDLKDIYMASLDLSLRPETTASSYNFLKSNLGPLSPPVCIWQAAKSFRKEQDKTFKNIRFKEFYQLEFQCIYSEGTHFDWYPYLIDVVFQLFVNLLSVEGTVESIVIEESDRLPSYSLKTTDIMYNYATDPMQGADGRIELCSISHRNDVPFTFWDKKLHNVEIAIGLDRLVYFFTKQYRSK